MVRKSTQCAIYFFLKLLYCIRCIDSLWKHQKLGQGWQQILKEEETVQNGDISIKYCQGFEEIRELRTRNHKYSIKWTTISNLLLTIIHKNPAKYNKCSIKSPLPWKLWEHVWWETRYLFKIAPDITIWSTPITYYSYINICTLEMFYQNLQEILWIVGFLIMSRSRTLSKQDGPLSSLQNVQQQPVCSQFQQMGHKQVCLVVQGLD